MLYFAEWIILHGELSNFKKKMSDDDDDASLICGNGDSNYHKFQKNLKVISSDESDLKKEIEMIIIY